MTDQRLAHLAPRVLLGCGAGLLLAGLATSGLIGQWAAGRAGELLLLALASLALAWPPARALRLPTATTLAGVWSLATLWMLGPLPVLGVAALGLAALGLGGAGPGREPAVAVATGLALLAGAFGWLLPFPVHTPWLYAGLLLVLVALCRARIAERASGLATRWRQAVAGAPRAAAFAVIVLGLAATGTWIPTVQHDDVGYHLALPWQLQTLGYYRLDPGSQVWALAPWAGDVLHGLAQVLAGREARGALNLLWLLLCARLTWLLCAQLRLAPRLCWLCVALFASHPLVALLAGGMQTELPTTALVLAFALLVLRTPAPEARTLYAIALLCGGLAALKLSNLALAAPLLGWLLLRWRGRLPWTALPGATLLALAVGGASYVYAWALAGNPVLPLFNAFFASPWYPAQDFVDPRWQGGLGPALPWSLVFDTERWIEGWSGAAGFVPVVLLGMLAVALGDARTRPLALVALAMVLLPLSQIQYLRYAQPGLMLMLPALVCALQRVEAPRLAAATLVTLACLNLAVQSHAGWTLRNGGLKRLLLAGGDPAPVLLHFAPERLLAEHVRTALDPEARVLFTDPDAPFNAELGPQGLTVSGYDPYLQGRARTAANAEDPGAWRAIFADTGATHVALRPLRTPPSLQAALAADDARAVYAAGDLELWALPERPATPFVHERDLGRGLREALPWR